MRLLGILAVILLTTGCSSTRESESTLRYDIRDETGSLIPGKLIFFKDGEKFDIAPPPEDDIAFRKNTLYTLSGSGELPLPPGQYEIWAGRGLEWSSYRDDIIINDGETVEYQARLKKQLETPGYISGDMHLHTFTHSGHGDSNVEERIVSCIGEGLEWAVATDHNNVIDYTPVMQKLDATGMISSTVGNEVSTPIGHFNTYPLEAGSEPVESNITDAHVLFKLIRESASAVVLQVNHPRWPSGDYFTFKNINEYYGTTNDETWSWDFDAIEILNVNSGLGWIEEPENPISVKRDWFNLLNRGRKITGVGNSDSHTVLTNLAGLPRNYIKSSTDNVAEINEDEVAMAIKEGNVSVSRGLYIEFSSGETEMGGTTSTSNGQIAFDVRVQGADWVDFDTLKLIRNGEEIQSLAINGNKETVRFTGKLEDSPSIDSWYIVVAKGNDPMTPLGDNADGSFFPLAFTNPIWVDADHDGMVTSVRAAAINALESSEINEASISDLIDDFPEFKPFIGEYLLSSDIPGREALLLTLSSKGDLYTRLFVYRALADLGNESSAKLLDNLPLANLSTLEQIEIELAKLSYFNDREQDLRSMLIELREKFKFYRSGAASHKVTLFSEDNTAQKEIISDQDGSLPINEGYDVFIEKQYFSRSNGTADFLIKAEQPIKVRLQGGESISIIPRQTLNNSLIQIPVSRGENTIRFNIGKENRVIIEPIYAVGPLVKNASGMKFESHLGVDKDFVQYSNHSPRYHAGNGALSDGFTGTSNYGDGFWRGYNEEIVDYVVDLGEVTPLSEISVNFLENQGAWIFLPSMAEIQVSEDSTSFTTIHSKTYELKRRDNVEITKISVDSSLNARFVRLFASSAGILPEWHAGKGENAWVFVDEIIIR